MASQLNSDIYDKFYIKTVRRKTYPTETSCAYVFVIDEGYTIGIMPAYTSCFYSSGYNDAALIGVSPYGKLYVGTRQRGNWAITQIN